MIRRPMCLICLLLMLCIWLLGLGDTAGVSSQKDPKLESLLAAQAICRIYEEYLGWRQAVTYSIFIYHHQIWSHRPNNFQRKAFE